MYNLVVAGAGEGTYKKLWDAIQPDNDPCLNMRLHVVMDIKPRDQLDERMERVLQDSGAIFHHLPDGVPPTSLDVPTNAVGIVMTPNDSHLQWGEFFAEAGIPVFLEKPAACSLEDIPRLQRLLKQHPDLIYCVEFCADGKALGMLLAAGVLTANDPRCNYVEVEGGLGVQEFQALFNSLEERTIIQGVLLEGSGTAGVADHRPWLLEGRSGGMIRDLISHLIGPVMDAGLIANEGKFAGVPIDHCDVELSVWKPGMPLGEFRPLQDPAEGETHARIFTFLARDNSGKEVGSVFFRVGKYWPEHERELTVQYMNGEVGLSYEPPYRFTITLEDGRTGAAIVTADPYTLALLDFVQFCQGKRDGHHERGVALVRFAETLRVTGLECL